MISNCTLHQEPGSDLVLFESEKKRNSKNSLQKRVITKIRQRLWVA